MARGKKTNANYCYITIKGLKKGSEKTYLELREANALTDIQFDQAVEDFRTEGKEFKLDRDYTCNEEGKKHRREELDFIEGDLFKIKIGRSKGTEEYPEKDTIMFYLRDKAVNENYTLSGNFGSISMVVRALMNKLLSLKDFNDIHIGVFKNKEGWPNLVFKSHGEKVEYMFDKDETKIHVTAVEYQGKTMNDYTKLDQMLLEKIKEVVIPQLEVSNTETEDLITEDVVQEVKEQNEVTTETKEETPTPMIDEDKAKDMPF
jgi:hypothetical protein